VLNPRGRWGRVVAETCQFTASSDSLPEIVPPPGPT
jgi:hypothetical protein